MAVYRCDVCDYQYDEAQEGVPFDELPDEWVCPVCASGKSYFQKVEEEGSDQAEVSEKAESTDDLEQYRRSSDDLETAMADIHRIAAEGHSIIEPMRTKRPVISFDDILFKGAPLHRPPLNKDEPVTTRTVIGPAADHPLVIETPIYVSHMSYGALSAEVKTALAKGSAAVKTAIGSGEGGILPSEHDNAYKYIFEYVPNRYSVTDENLKRVDAVEIKFGQSTKPGMGGHLPAEKVTEEIAAVRGFPAGQDIISPSRFDDINSSDDLKKKIDWLREKTGGKPIGVKLAAGHIEADLDFVIPAGPDFVTIDGRPGGTGASPKLIKASTSIPTLFALYRAKYYLRENNITNVSLVITGGLRLSPDFAKALAMGADAVAIATAAMIACGCQQYRVCHQGKCPVGIATQDPELRKRLDIKRSARNLANFLRVSTDEIREFARLTGNDDVHKLAVTDLCTVNSEISDHTEIQHV